MSPYIGEATHWTGEDDSPERWGYADEAPEPEAEDEEDDE